TALHLAAVNRIAHMAAIPANKRCLPVLITSPLFKTPIEQCRSDFLTTLFKDGYRVDGNVTEIKLNSVDEDYGRDDRYWSSQSRRIRKEVENLLERSGGTEGDAPYIAIAGIADMPLLALAGSVIGDRIPKAIFSFTRNLGFSWVNKDAKPPVFTRESPCSGDGPIALVLSVSALIPENDILAVLPGARIARFGLSEPSYQAVTGPKVITEFARQLQAFLSELEASTPDPIHVFMAIPAALTIEFGAVLSTNHQHGYRIYDRMNDLNNQNNF